MPKKKTTTTNKNTKKETDATAKEVKSVDAQSSRIKELEEQLKAAKEREDLIAKLSEQNERLMTLVHAQRVAKDRQEEDNAPHEVECSVNMYVHVSVFDVNGVNRKNFRFDGKGAKHRMTRSQIEELRANYPTLFEKGYLSAPTIIEDNQNVIGDVQEYIDNLSEDEIREKIREIDSEVALSQLYNYIETLRYGDMVEGSEGVMLEELDIPIKYEAIERAVQRRMLELRGVDIKLDM